MVGTPVFSDRCDTSRATAENGHALLLQVQRALLAGSN
jgi:hypothetical protein